MKPLKVIDAGLVPYATACRWQQELHRRRVDGKIPDVLLLLEHPNVYTLGRRFSREHLLVSEAALAERGIEVHEADRGGSITYHGPGQLVGYPILDLRRGPPEVAEPPPDAILYLRRLEEAMIRAVRSYGVAAVRREGLTGVWVGEGKLGAIGVNVTRGVTKHGFALNVTTDLSYFEAMVPCGIPDARATSLEELLGTAPPMADVTARMVSHLAKVLHRLPVSGTTQQLGLTLEARPQPAGEVIVFDPSVGGRRRGAAGE